MRQVLPLPGGSWQRKGFGALHLPGGVWHTTEKGVVVPPNQLVLPASSFGATGGRFHYDTTTPTEWVGGISSGIGSLTADVRTSIAQSNPNIGLAIDGVEAVILASTGENPGVAVPSAVLDIAADLLTNIIDGNTSVSSAVSAAADSVGSAGAIIGVAVQVAKFIIAAVAKSTEPKISAREEQDLREKFKRYCNSTVVPSNMSHPRQLVGTGPGSRITPADMVAQGDARMRLWRWLCGGASRNGAVRSDYNQWFKSASKAYGIVGIPLHIQRQMVGLIDGIYAARINPEAPLGTNIGDGGETLFNVLAQITYDEGTKTPQPAFNLTSLRSMADNFISPGRQVCVLADDPGSECQNFPPCRHVFSEIDVGFSLHNFLFGYGADLGKKRNWDNAGYKASMKRPSSELTLNEGATNRYLEAVEGTLSAAEKKRQAAVSARRSSVTKAAAATSVVILGAGGFYLARRAAKKRRR